MAKSVTLLILLLLFVPASYAQNESTPVQTEVSVQASEDDFKPLPEPEIILPVHAPVSTEPKIVEMLDIDALVPDVRAPYVAPKWASTELLGIFESPNGDEPYVPEPAPAFTVAPRSQLATRLPEKGEVAPVGVVSKTAKNSNAQSATAASAKNAKAKAAFLAKKAAAKKAALAKAAWLKKKKKKAIVRPVDLDEEDDREPASDDNSPTYVFTDAIRGITDFNGQWEVSFRTEPGRFRLMGQPDEISDFQGNGTFLKVTVDRATRRILSLEPIQVRFRPIR